MHEHFIGVGVVHRWFVSLENRLRNRNAGTLEPVDGLQNWINLLGA
jgi:hypothetical protein